MGIVVAMPSLPYPSGFPTGRGVPGNLEERVLPPRTSCELLVVGEESLSGGFLMRFPELGCWLGHSVTEWAFNGC